jgi:hypothetical protein
MKRLVNLSAKQFKGSIITIANYYRDLNFNQLTGSIPPELGNLTNLTEL